VGLLKPLGAFRPYSRSHTCTRESRNVPFMRFFVWQPSATPCSQLLTCLDRTQEISLVTKKCTGRCVAIRFSEYSCAVSRNLIFASLGSSICACKFDGKCLGGQLNAKPPRPEQRRMAMTNTPIKLACGSCMQRHAWQRAQSIPESRLHAVHKK